MRRALRQRYSFALCLNGLSNFRWRPGVAPPNLLDGSIAIDQGGSESMRDSAALGLLKDMETRLANWLLKHCPRPVGAAQVEIKLNRTKRVLAAEMGTTSETLSRTLAKFRDQKFLRVKGNTVVVTRPRELQKLLQRNLGEL